MFATVDVTVDVSLATTTIPQIDADRWDDFVARHPLGHHEQTSQFALIRAQNGFQCARVGIESPAGELIGGAQVLFRRVPLAGALAFVTQGPLVSPDRPDAREAVLGALDHFAREHGVVRLRIINYAADESWAPSLSRTGHVRSGYRWVAAVTSLVRCDDDDDAILGRMRPRCRSSIRHAEREGVSVRIGGEGDIDAFHRMLQETAHRQGFAIFPLEYFQHTWRLFAPDNRLKLFLAHADGEPAAGVIATVVGDRVYAGWAAMSSRRTHLKASYAAHWAAIRWARSLGHQYYDFSSLGGGHGVDRFKRRWGGMEVLYPDPFDKYYGALPGLRRRASDLAWDNVPLRRLMGRIDYRLRGPTPY